MRLWGFNAAYQPGSDLGELFQRARSEGRLVVTRSSRVWRWAPGEVLHLKSDRLEDQLREVMSVFRPGPEEVNPLTRCSLCNQELRGVSRDEVRGQVPPFVWRTQEGFGRCPSCGRIYWMATHGRAIHERFSELRAEGDPDEEKTD